MDKYEYLEKVNKLEQEAYKLDMEGWFANELFSWNWWVLLLFFIVPWAIWGRLVDRRKILESVLFGALIVIITSLLDLIGMNLKFWRYPVQLLPIIPRALAFDMSMVPIAFMLLHQYFNTWKNFGIGLFIMSILFAFVGEPLSIKMELVQYIKWKFIYSFIYYILIGLFVRWIVIKLRERSHKP